MRSAFDELLDLADSAVDLLNAEPFIFTPMARPANGRPREDGERFVVEGEGIFDYRPGEGGGIQVGNRSHARARNDMKTLVNGMTPTLSITSRTLGGQEVRQGDRVELVDRSARERLWDVVSAQPDGHGRVMLELVKA